MTLLQPLETPSLVWQLMHVNVEVMWKRITILLCREDEVKKDRKKHKNIKRGFFFGVILYCAYPVTFISSRGQFRG